MLRELAKQLRTGQTTSQALVDLALQRAEGNVHNALISTNPAQARAACEHITLDHALAGLPFAHKDLFCTPHIATTCGSKMLANFVPPYAATIVQRLNDTGAISIGKANMDEFAMGSSNELSAFGAVKNPWDVARVPGGSSGGSAALVAARVVPFATASDTGGSIRQPAAFCGVTGFKPTYGRVSRFGMVAYGSSLDCPGVIAESAEDCALVLQVMAGTDLQDGTCSTHAVPDYLATLNKSVTGLKIGVARQMFESGVDPAVAASVMAGLKKFEAMGACLVDVDLPYQDAAIAAYYVVASSEASSNLSRFDGVRYGYRSPNAKTLADLYEQSRSEAFGAEVQARILVGTYALSAGYFDAYYLRAQKVRRLITQGYQDAFGSVDLIAMPSAPTTAFKLGEKLSDPKALYMADALTVGVNLAGLPAISLPCGLVDGLPVGLQLIGPHFAEVELLAASHQFQQQTDFHLARPKGVDAFTHIAR